MDARQKGSLFQTIATRAIMLGLALYIVTQAMGFVGHAFHGVTTTLAQANAAAAAGAN